MQYSIKEGKYWHAYQDVLINGGQLFPGRGKDSSHTVLRGKQIIIYWPKNSKRRHQVKELCDFFGLESETYTGGRLARWLIENLLELPYKQTFWNKNYRALAKKGEHWHYLYCEPLKLFYGIEVDLKSAYFRSLLQGKSLLYYPGRGYLNDDGAIEHLAFLEPFLPKWFRLQLLGIMASWRMRFMCRDKKNPDNKELIFKQRMHIEYNAAFNATHRAILRNYKLLAKIKEIGGEYIRRVHTDSFTMDADIPESIEISIWNYLEDNQAEWDIKGAGRCYFIDVNAGFVGRKIIGSWVQVFEELEERSIKIEKDCNSRPVLDRWEKIILNSSLPEKEYFQIPLDLRMPLPQEKHFLEKI